MHVSAVRTSVSESWPVMKFSIRISLGSAMFKNRIKMMVQ